MRCSWAFCQEPATKQVLLRRKEQGVPVRWWYISDPYCDEHGEIYKTAAYIYQDVAL